MNWNYRLFDVSDENGGDPYFTVREVYYGADGEPVGWSKATLGDETVEGCRKQLERILEDIQQPVLRTDDMRMTNADVFEDALNEGIDIVVDKRLKSGDILHIDTAVISPSELFMPIAKKEGDK